MSEDVDLEEIDSQLKSDAGLGLEEFQTKLEERIESDSDFEQKFKDTPGQAARELIESETGQSLPNDFEENFRRGMERAEEKKDEIELSDEQLEDVSGGIVLSGTALALTTAAIGAGGAAAGGAFGALGSIGAALID